MGETGDDSETVDEKPHDNEDDEKMKILTKMKRIKLDHQLRMMIKDQTPHGGTDDVEDMNIDKDEVFAETTGLKSDALDVGPNDDIEMNQQDDIDQNKEEDVIKIVDESTELNECEKESNKENPKGNGTETVIETSEMETKENSLRK
nr:midasin isoform X2 [Tanacetum cinerariifolium]